MSSQVPYVSAANTGRQGPEGLFDGFSYPSNSLTLDGAEHGVLAEYHAAGHRGCRRRFFLVRDNDDRRDRVRRGLHPHVAFENDVERVVHVDGPPKHVHDSLVLGNSEKLSSL